ncbi:MAG: hypothetical protein FWF81_09305 [Defluviitaleaceae bacterium]|nr:hypothetical protein [Defluviitaleaceae bacterium]
MDFIQEYLAGSEQEQYMMLRNIMHALKYDEDDEIQEALHKLELPNINEENQLPLVRMAVYLGHSYAKRTGKELPWVFNPALVLDKPYKGVGYRDAWFFCGEQVFYRHNYFTDPRSLDVL